MRWVETTATNTDARTGNVKHVLLRLRNNTIFRLESQIAASLVQQMLDKCYFISYRSIITQYHFYM